MSTHTGVPSDIHGDFESVRDQQRRRLRGTPGESWAARAVRQVTGIVTADPYPQQLTEAAAGVQGAVTTGRRVAVIGTRGGSGRTTTAALLARVIGALRTDPVTVLDAAGARGTLALRLAPDRALPPAREVLDAAGRVPASVADLTGALAPAGRNLWAASASAADGALEDLVVAASRFCAVTLVDAPVLHGDPAATAGSPAGFAGAHALLQVAPCTVAGLDDARWLAGTLAAGPASPPLLTVLVDVQPGAGLDVDAEARQLDHDGVPALPLRHDRHLAAGVEFDLALLARSTRLQATALASALVRTAIAGVPVTTATPGAGTGGGPGPGSAAR
ncbi:hypothetical protein GCM10011512_25090 [Tersicoccus solisilvae]|uniref:CobQ/CobB/MinD/ParA nucleotide binding domain-containing protein n=1 Tax=Tersicoccus solisilvae TaxID=1882339 RepID=A0ABQ1PH15_9MICC|nr:hypothetical protein [Tersicoccus solisilvae]GGC97073.1 hypothetical protein GCM10011512_25090 [Tersicoccus solisilvae]